MMRYLTGVAFILVAIIAFATPYIPPEEITTHIGETRAEVPEIDVTYNHLAEFVQITGFEQELQFLDTGSNFGGEREEEEGGGYWIIETDNTLEAIWVWSRYCELSSTNWYNRVIDNAWIYAYNYPAWQEGAGYYSSHNCAWALAAERQFRETFNDSTHWNYAVSSADYIVQTELSFGSTLNVMVTGWCCGNLYLYGEAIGNQDYMEVACRRARQIIDWIEENPSYRLGMESWAMSSGTFIWGICNSLFRQNPEYGQQWLETYGPMVQVFEPYTGGWSNAWNVAYCNAQGGMFDVTGDSTYLQNHLWLTNFLLSKDQDNDGGIPSSAAGSQNADASWTTSYLAMMGCDRYISEDIDAGVLAISSPRNGSILQVGQNVLVAAVIGNWSNIPLNSIMVTCSGAYVDTQYLDLSAGRTDRIDFGYWMPSSPGNGSIRVTTNIPGDINTMNNSESTRFIIQGIGTEITNKPAEYQTNDRAAFCKAVSATSGVMFSTPEDGNVSLTLYNITGQRIFTIFDGYLSSGVHNISDLRGNFQSFFNSLPSGIYLTKLATDQGQDIFKMAKLR